jgi:hypothetical protein
MLTSGTLSTRYRGPSVWVIVPVDHAVAVETEHGAVADHSERVQLGGTQRAHAGTADDPGSRGEHSEDFLVPHRGVLVVVAVDDHCGVAGTEIEPQQVAVRGRGMDRRVRGDRQHLLGGQRRADEDVYGHGSP